MGFFSKVFKGIGKVFRKIGRGLKKVVGKIGKMFGKLGIVGQIGLGLLLPGVGQMLSGMLGSVGGALAGSSSALLQGAGKFIQGAIKIGTKVGNAFSTITEGVTKVIGETVGAVVNQIPGAGDLLKNISGGRIDITQKTFGSVWETAQGAMSDAISAGKDIFGLNARQNVLDAIPESLALPEETQALQQQLQVEVPTMQDLQFKLTEPTDSLLGMPKTSGIPTTNVTPYVESTSTSFLKDPSKAMGEMYEKVKSEFTGENLAKTGISAVKSGITSTVVGGLEKVAGLRPDPQYTQYSGYVPTIDMSGTTDIGAAQEPFDAVAYMANNVDSINMNPYGYNANIYNAANYQNYMRQFGYA